MFQGYKNPPVVLLAHLNSGKYHNSPERRWQECVFGTKYVCRLDEKFRLVLPVCARESLGIDDAVVLEISGDRIFLKKPNGERKHSIVISKNTLEVV